MEFGVVWGNRALEKKYSYVGNVAVKALSNFWITIAILNSMPEKAIGTLSEKLARIIMRLRGCECTHRSEESKLVGTPRRVLNAQPLSSIDWRQNSEYRELKTETYGWFYDAYWIAS